MLTGRQVREARKLLGWSQAELSRNTFLPLAVVEAAEKGENATMLFDGQALAIRRVCEGAGIEFAIDDGNGPGVRLRKDEAN